MNTEIVRSEDKNYLVIPKGGRRNVFVTATTEGQRPVVYVGEGSPGCFPSSAGLDVEDARRVRDALTEWINDQAGEVSS